jgi:hypothetical protein
MPKFNVEVNIVLTNMFEDLEADDEDEAREMVEQSINKYGMHKFKGALSEEADPEVRNCYDEDAWEITDTEVTDITEQDEDAE